MSGSDDATLKIWDVETGECKQSDDVDGVNFHARRLIGDGVVVATAEDDAFGNAIAVAVALSSASIGAENVVPRFVVHDEPIQPARDDFAIAEARTVFPASFAMPMERT